MIDQKTIEHISKLARLSINQDEAVEYQQQLNKVLDHFKQISKIQTDGIEPLVTPTEVGYILRKDNIEQTTKTDEILAQAPDRAGNLFKVPPVV